ncbi:hypothetical protein PUN28_011235 [Cardiocondyla obscurior]|uniref:Uncharacterized protein n=1 Tax=Cardiocondyla obscurior TaxID=286306 RepID=A0AAW2FQ81_9HYME
MVANIPRPLKPRVLISRQAFRFSFQHHFSTSTCPTSITVSINALTFIFISSNCNNILIRKKKSID